MSKHIAADELLKQKSKTLPLIIDVRSESEFNACHLAGAVNIPLDKLEEALTELEDAQEIVTYCNMNRPGHSRSEKAAELLREKGFDVRVLEGGLPAAETAGMPSEKKD
jgi:rhodanese-related sulfurtransferase